MRRVWQTVDGKVFTDQLDAEKHEQEILQGITMWDWDGDHTNECGNAMIVKLVGKNAAHNFKLINNSNCESIPVSDKEIGDEDEGIWFWDEYEECYCAIEPKVIKAFSKISNELG